MDTNQIAEVAYELTFALTQMPVFDWQLTIDETGIVARITPNTDGMFHVGYVTEVYAPEVHAPFSVAGEPAATVGETIKMIRSRVEDARRIKHAQLSKAVESAQRELEEFRRKTDSMP